MKSFIIIIIIFLTNGAIFAQKEIWSQPKQLKAYTYPMGTIKMSNLVGPNSKSYKFETPIFEESTKFQVFQSEYVSTSPQKVVDHSIGGNYYEKGSSATFSIIIDNDENNDLKMLISYPGRSIGVLNFKKDKNNVIKYKFFNVSSPQKNSKIPVVLLYEDNREGEIEKKISNISLLDDLAQYERIIPDIKNIYLIYYTYNNL